MPINLYYDVAVRATGGGGKQIALVKFADMREDVDSVVFECNSTREVVGRARIPGQDAGAWVTNALAAELSQGGFRVATYSDAPGAGEPVVVTGELYEMYYEWHKPVTQYCCWWIALIGSAWETTRSWVKVQVTVEKGGIPIISSQYMGRASKSGSANRQDVELSLDKALQDLMKKLVPDVVAAAGL
jgi:hypothetical protein